MADVLVVNVIAAVNERRALHGPYWVSPSVGYIVTQDADSDINVMKTADSGATWTLQDTANEPTSANNRSMGVWFDQETPGNSGTLLHIAWVQITDNEAHYIAFDTSDDTFGTDRTIDALTISSTSADSDVSVTLSISGRVYVAARGDWEQDTENTNHSMRSSSDGFATNNESELSPYSSDEEVVKLFPGADADEDDISAVVYDVINTDLEFWKFDASANTWGVTAIDTDMSLVGSEARSFGGFDAAIRHSDKHILVVYFTDLDSATGDFRSADITQVTPTITAKTALHENVDDSFFPGLLINQQNDDVYAGYAGSDAGDETMFSQLQVYFKKSADGMGTWGSEVPYRANLTLDDMRKVSAGRTIGDAGGRVMPVWYNDDPTTKSVVNDGNDIEVAAAPSITAALTGTALPSATEAEIAAGGETVIITLTGDTWLDAGGAFDGSRQAIIDGFDAATSPTNGWNNEVRDKAPTSVAVRTNATTVTMTWTSAASAYDISSAETIAVTIPASALTTSADPITADETFEITVVAVGLSIPIVMHYYRQRRN